MSWIIIYYPPQFNGNKDSCKTRQWMQNYNRALDRWKLKFKWAIKVLVVQRDESPRSLTMKTSQIVFKQPLNSEASGKKITAIRPNFCLSSYQRGNWIMHLRPGKSQVEHLEERHRDKEREGERVWERTGRGWKHRGEMSQRGGKLGPRKEWGS